MRHWAGVVARSVIVSAVISAVALIVVPWPALEAPPEPVDVARVLPYAPTTTSTTTTRPAVTVAPGSAMEANDVGDPTFIPANAKPATTTTRPPTTTTARPAVSGWVATGEQRATDSTVYCATGVTYSGGHTHAEGAGVGRTVAVNRDNGEWGRYVGTSWRVLTGPHTGAVYTVEDAGTRAHFDMWHGDRADCRDYSLRSYGVQPITVERVEFHP